jgi:hypothetical protein
LAVYGRPGQGDYEKEGCTLWIRKKTILMI